jgi:tetratricopeptide (TPR) repeat protein
VAASLGNAYYSLGDYQRAIEFLSQHREMAEAIGDKGGVANSLSGLGLAYHSLGDYQRAIDFHSQHRELAEAIGDRWGEGASYFNLAQAQAKLDDHWAAKQNLEKAKAIYTALKLDHMVEQCDQAIRERNQIIAATPIKAPPLEEPEALPDWYLKSLPANETKPRTTTTTKISPWLWAAAGLSLALLIAYLRR